MNELFEEETVSQRKLHVGKGDEVLVLSGKDVGRRGVILSIFPDKSRAVVEGIHMIKRHMRPNQMGEGGIVEREGTIHISNLKLICPKCHQPTRTKSRGVPRDIGNRTKTFRERVCKKCGEIASQN